MLDTAALLETYPEITDALRTLEAAKNAISAAQAHLAAEMTDTLAHEAAGYATPKSFLRAELGLDTNRANDLLAAGPTLQVLPALDEVATEGAVSLDHVKHFTYCLNHVGESVTREYLPELVDVATKAEPASLRMVTLNPPGVSGDSDPWEGWSHVSQNVKEVPGRVA